MLALLIMLFSFQLLALDVAVVGAGASGLIAAHYLRQAGHSVTIFEKNERVGGKVYSFELEGTTIELGGLLVPSGFKTIHSLINIYGPRPEVFPSKVLFLNKNNRWQKFKGYSPLGPVRTLLQLKRLLNMYRRFPELNTPHLLPNIHPDLFLSLKDLAKKYGFQQVLPPLVMSLSASGYLYAEVIPAYYALKLFKTVLPVGIHGYVDNINPFSSPYIKGLKSFKHGYSQLWENIAAQFEVRLNEEVTAITAGEVTTLKGSYQFDRVVVSTDLPTARSIVMKPSRELIKLAESLRSHRLLVSVIKTQDLPRKNKHSFFFYPNMNASRTNHIQSLVNFWNNDELYVAYQNLSEGLSLDEAQGVLAQDLWESLGVRNFQRVKQVEWDYFHHLPPAGLTPSVAAALTKLQGQDGIYFVGESLNFESTESAAANARWVVEKYFTGILKHDE